IIKLLLTRYLIGRLYQVEYAMEAISHAGTALGILASDGIVIAAEKKVTSKLLEQTTTSEKIYLLNEYKFLTSHYADANYLINYSRRSAQEYLYTYGEDIPVEQLVQRLCDLKQGYTQYGGNNKISLKLFVKLKEIEYRNNIITTQSLLKQDYKDEITLKEARELAAKVLSKTMDSTTLNEEGKVSYHLYKPDEIDSLLREHNLGGTQDTEERPTTT
ncbi:13365_t:CDS:2, partial [Racocetra fulgida]